MSSPVPRAPAARGRVAEAAAIVARHRLERTPLPALPEGARPRDEAEAYEVQRAVHALIEAGGAGRRAGWKIGCTNPAMQEYLGVDHPCSGGVPGSAVHSLEGRFRHADHVRPGVECEIAVRLGRTLRAADGPFRPADVLPAVAEVMAAVEVVDDRYEDRTALDVPTLVADDFFDAGCVLGPPRAPDMDLAALEGELRIDGRAEGRGRGTDLLGHPLEALAWLASHPAAAGGALEAGEFVLLGSVTEVRWVEPGASVEASFEGLGKARAVFAPEGRGPR